MAPDPDGDVGLLHRFGIKLDSVNIIILAVELRLVLGPEYLEYLQNFVTHGTALGVGNSQSFELLLQPTDAHAADDASIGEHIQRGKHLGLDYRVTVGQDDHGAADFDGVSAGSQETQKSHGFQERVIRRPGERAIGCVRILVGSLGGQHQMVAQKH